MKRNAWVMLMFGLLASGFFFTATAAKPQGQMLDSVVAVVNDDIITQSELNSAVQTVKMQIAHEQVAAPSDNVLRKQVLEQLINKKLQLQIAKQVGIEITDADIDKAINTITKTNNITKAALYQQIQQEGMTVTDYRKELHEQLTIQKLEQQEIASHIVITPQEIEEFTQSQNYQQNGAKEYHLQDILIPLSDTPSPQEIEAAKTKAEALLKELKKGRDFNQAALSESGDNHALQGGDLGWRSLAEIPSAFAEKVAHMDKGAIAGPIQTPNGFHIIRLVNVKYKNGNAANKLDRKQIEMQLLQRKFEELLQNWLAKIRSQAYIVINTPH